MPGARSESPITTTNNGPGTATGVTLNDPLPGGSGVDWSIDSGTGCSITGTAPTQTLGCTYGDLAAGASKAVHVVSGTAFASCAEYNNVATVDATNHATVKDHASTTVQCPDLSVTKVADAGTRQRWKSDRLQDHHLQRWARDGDRRDLE